MNQSAILAVAAMLHQFGDRGNPDVAIANFEEALHDVPEQIVVETASRFKAGRVEGQSLDHPPSSARFASEARRLTDLRAYRPKLGRPAAYQSSSTPPFMVNAEKARQKFQHCDIFKEGITYTEFKSMAAQGQTPPGLAGKDWHYSACLGTIFVERAS